MAKVKIKNFASEDEKFKWLHDNQAILKAERKSEPKKADGFGFVSFAIDERGEKLKSEEISQDVNVLNVRCVINTTGLFDSHKDLHVPGIWKKSLSESKLLYLCQEHDLSFKGIVSDEVKAFTKKYSWKELGFDFEGDTEALVFDSVVYKERNEFMFNQYKNGYVRNHSVRMQYIKEYFCMNSNETSHTQYKENWDKYIPLCANKEAAELYGWMYAVTEAKIIEGSAVVNGSNFVTPTLEVIENNKQAEKSLDHKEPSTDTQTRKKVFIN